MPKRGAGPLAGTERDTSIGEVGFRCRVLLGGLIALVACGGAPSGAGETDPGDDGDGTTLPTFSGGDGAESGGDTDDGSDDGDPLCETLAPRQLRLLTRAEYESTVADLFALEPRASCETDNHCPSGSACNADGACVLTSVPLTELWLPADGHTWSTVHVAGTFNDWTPTVGAGLWSLEYDGDTQTWRGAFDISEGVHEYKFVLDETDWITDPTNPETTGEFNNSVLTVEGETQEVDVLGLGLGSELPAESRPPGFPFDNNAEAGLVSATHVEAYMRAAGTVAQLALDTRDTWQPCDPHGDGACAQTFAADLGLRVFRRPLQDAERHRYADIAAADGASLALEAMLVSPSFLYRSEIGEPDGDRFRLTGHEIATSLAYTLTGSTPDDALLAAAGAGELETPAGIEAHARRLLDDPRARDTLGRFAAQWLGVEQIATVDKNAQLFPMMNAPLRASMLEETRRFVEYVAFDGTGRYDELLTADYSFVDARLAALYDMQPPAGQGLKRAELPADRAGLLGHASVLGSYAYSDQSSPVRRGLFVRRRILCQELPEPPPDAGSVPEIDPDATTRERFDQHSSDPACAGCHVLIDPVGFGFEHFDAVGAFRAEDAGEPVDASGIATAVGGIDPDDEAFDGVVELGALLATSPEAPACLARQYFRFAHGRLETEDDSCAVEALADAFATADHDLVELFVATLTAGEFRYRR